MSTFSGGDRNSAIPFFNYIKYLGDYKIYHDSFPRNGYSRAALRSVQPAFTVEERYSTSFNLKDFDYSTPIVEVRIESEGLRELFRRALQRQRLSHTVNLATLLPYYEVLKSFLAEEEQRHAENEQCREAPDLNILELRLFVGRFLLDRTIFRGFGLEDRQDFPSSTHWQDMQQWSTQRDLDGLDSLFVEEGTSRIRWYHYHWLTSLSRFKRVEPFLAVELEFERQVVKLRQELEHQVVKRRQELEHQVLEQLPGPERHQELKHFLELEHRRKIEREKLEHNQELERQKFHHQKLQRQKLGRLLRESLEKDCPIFLEKLRILPIPPSENFMWYGESSPTVQDVWNEGMRTVRALFRNHLPRTLKEVCSCLLVANAMREAGEEGLDLGDTKPLFCNWEEFLVDLDRWRLIVNEEDKPRYDDIVYALWGKTKSDSSPYTDKPCIIYFQELFQNLIDMTGVHDVPPDGHENLRSIHTQYTGASYLVSPPMNNQDHDEEIPEIHKERWKVVMLAATAIFGAVIALLLFFRYADDVQRALAMIAVHKNERSDWGWIVLRNCLVLAVYLGLSEIKIQSDVSKLSETNVKPYLQHSVSPSKKIQKYPTVSNSNQKWQCQYCDKSFCSNSSLGEHMRSGCRIVSEDQYWCQHCGKGDKKKWNLRRHEEKCGLARSRPGNRVKKSQDYKKSGHERIKRCGNPKVTPLLEK